MVGIYMIIASVSGALSARFDAFLPGFCTTIGCSRQELSPFLNEVLPNVNDFPPRRSSFLSEESDFHTY